MKRAMIVLSIAVVTAAVSGIDSSWASQRQTPQAIEAHRQEIAARLKGIPIGSAIEVEPAVGRKFQALLEDVTADAITVRLVSGNYSLTRTIPLDEIKDLKEIDKIGVNHTLRNLRIGAAIGVGVLVGTCVAANASPTSPRGR